MGRRRKRKKIGGDKGKEEQVERKRMVDKGK